MDIPSSSNAFVKMYGESLQARQKEHIEVEKKITDLVKNYEKQITYLRIDPKLEGSKVKVSNADSLYNSVLDLSHDFKITNEIERKLDTFVIALVEDYKARKEVSK